MIDFDDLKQAELERGMINARTKAGIDKAKADGVKFGRTLGSKNQNTNDKHEKIKIFLQAKKSYSWITNELKVSKQTVSEIKKNLASEKSEFGLKTPIWYDIFNKINAKCFDII